MAAGARPLVLGLDIGGTKLAAGVVDAAGNVLSSCRARTPVGQGWPAAVAALLRLGDAALERGGVRGQDLSGIGIGCGGPLDLAAGLVLGPPNLPDWDYVPVVAAVEDHFNRPTLLENDASAAALGTHLWGAFAGCPNFVYLTISSGVGSGVVLDGKLFRGAAGNGTEIGHTLVDWRGRRCACGQRGCVEAYLSGTSIAQRARDALDSGRPSVLRQLSAITAADVSQAAAADDQVAREVWDETTAILGRVVATVLNAFEPELVVLGGGVTQSGAMLLDPVRRAALAQAMPPAAAAGDVVLSSHGSLVGVVGAAAVALSPLRHAVAA